MASFFKKIASIFKPVSQKDSSEKFRQKFQYFQNLLASNDHALERMSILGDMLQQKAPFAFGKGRRLIMEILAETRRIITNLEGMYHSDFAVLRSKLNEIYAAEEPLLNLSSQEQKKNESINYRDLPYYFDLQRVNRQYISEVGGKMARLGEVKNVLHLPVPDGVCITSRCFEEFLTENNLRDKINDLAGNLDINNSVELQEVSRAIQAMLVSAPISPEIENEILKAYDRLSRRVGKECTVAVRSSAVGEDDPVHSFAGLHYTALNVSRHNLVDACWEVLISKYLPESMVYRFVTGLRDIDMPMNIGCMIMLNSKVSGTLFTVDPQRRKPGMIIQAVRGVGALVVEGKVVPQEYVVERNTAAKVLDFDPGNQTYLLEPRESDGLDQVEFKVTGGQTHFLSQKQIEFLTGYGLTIEAHFGIPQDIEWAVTQDDNIYILQTRPLGVLDAEKSQPLNQSSLMEFKNKYPVILDGGDCACRGIDSGPVFIATQERFLVNFPDGGILVVRKTSPAYARVLHKAAAVITEVGSTTSHLSIIARELGVPTILNLKDAVKKLANGQEVIVDANHGIVFAGKMDKTTQMESDQKNSGKPFHQTPIYKMINNAVKHILPLNLTNPQAPEFAAKNCRTAHDITRFCHEISILEMFKISDSRQNKMSAVRKLAIPIHLEIYVVDLGGGLAEHVGSQKVTPDEILSQPFNALLEGMSAPGLPWSGPVPMDLRGFAGLIVNTMVDAGRARREMGSRSYAVISPQYVNFSARLGYHFSNLDAYAGESVHRNYISYRFKGGAADSTRRIRRARFISEVLKEYGFHVVQKGDHVHSTIRKIDEQEVLYLLKNIGRLLGAIRNADVTMVDDQQIQLYARAFLDGSNSPVATVRNSQTKKRTANGG